MPTFELLKEEYCEEEVRPKRIGATTESIALIASNGSTGAILVHDGPGIEADIEALGYGHLDDHGLDDAPPGLSIWEGHLRVTQDHWTAEVDTELVGSFRDLTDEEWTLLRETGTPWAFEPAPRSIAYSETLPTQAPESL